MTHKNPLRNYQGDYELAVICNEFDEPIRWAPATSIEGNSMLRDEGAQVWVWTADGYCPKGD